MKHREEPNKIIFPNVVWQRRVDSGLGSTLISPGQHCDLRSSYSQPDPEWAWNLSQSIPVSTWIPAEGFLFYLGPAPIDGANGTCWDWAFFSYGLQSMSLYSSTFEHVKVSIQRDWELGLAWTSEDSLGSRSACCPWFEEYDMAARQFTHHPLEQGISAERVSYRNNVFIPLRVYSKPKPAVLAHIIFQGCCIILAKWPSK